MHVFDGRANGERPVVHDFQVQGLGQIRLQIGQGRFEPIHGLDHIGTGLALHIDDDGVLLIGPSGHANVLWRVAQGGNIFQAKGVAIFIGDDQFGVLFGRAHLVVGVQGGGSLGSIKAALGHVHIGLGNGRTNVFQRKPTLTQSTWVDLNPNGGTTPST